jgi:hypothetical protein
VPFGSPATYRTRPILLGAIGVPNLAFKCLAKTKHIHEDAVDTILTRGMRVGFRGLLGELVGAVHTPSLRVAEEEAR